MNIGAICEMGPTVYSPCPRRLESLYGLMVRARTFYTAYMSVLTSPLQWGPTRYPDTLLGIWVHGTCSEIYTAYVWT